MCSCRKNKNGAAATTYTVTYPGGTTEDVRSEVAAKLKVGKVPGATYAAKTPAPASA